MFLNHLKSKAAINKVNNELRVKQFFVDVLYKTRNYSITESAEDSMVGLHSKFQNLNADVKQG